MIGLARYEHITRFISAVEAINGPTPKAEMADLHRELVEAFYEPFLLAEDYIVTLENSGMIGPMAWHANVESLPMDLAVAILVLLHRSERGMYEPGGKTPLMEAFENGYAVRLLKRIAELDGTWKRPNVVTFYHEYEKDGYLSNWYESSPFTYQGHTFATSEHWMMWQKACVFGSWGTAEQILALPASQQGKVKWLGKNKVPGFDPDVWEAVDLQLMRVGLRQKFVQNERLLNDLLGTGLAVLGEAAGVKDKKWGVGFDKHSPKLADPANWYGDSLLGRTLMEVRAELRQLCAMDGRLEWPVDALRESQVWRMNLLELARVPSTRSFALMYATIVAQQCPTNFSDARDVLRKVRASIGQIDESMQGGEGSGLPVTGWHELLDELALQARLGKL